MTQGSGLFSGPAHLERELLIDAQWMMNPVGMVLGHRQLLAQRVAELKAMVGQREDAWRDLVAISPEPAVETPPGAVYVAANVVQIRSPEPGEPFIEVPRPARAGCVWLVWSFHHRWIVWEEPFEGVLPNLTAPGGRA